MCTETERGDRVAAYAAAAVAGADAGGLTYREIGGACSGAAEATIYTWATLGPGDTDIERMP